MRLARGVNDGIHFPVFCAIGNQAIDIRHFTDITTMGVVYLVTTMEFPRMLPIMGPKIIAFTVAEALPSPCPQPHGRTVCRPDDVTFYRLAAYEAQKVVRPCKFEKLAWGTDVAISAEHIDGGLCGHRGKLDA
jgi:hypothetical protein